MSGKYADLQGFCQILINVWSVVYQPVPARLQYIFRLQSVPGMSFSTQVGECARRLQEMPCKAHRSPSSSLMTTMSASSARARKRTL
jgi:hypothetical protein